MAYQIPLFDLNFDEKEEEAVLEVLRSKWISIGPKTEAFENKFAELFNVKHTVALANCTVALHLALKILGIEEGDEVICPSLTFVATVNSIKYVGAQPVFYDINGVNNLNANVDHVKSLVTSKTKAIVVMHYAGFPCDMDRIMEVARENNLKVIEDACHGPLSEYRGQKLGTIGDIGCFSFFSNKNISTGEGGMLVTNKQEFAERAKLLRSHGMTSLSYQRAKGHTTSYDVVDLGYNYRMDDIRSAIGLVQLEKLPEDLNKRTQLRKLYEELLIDIEEIEVPFKDHDGFVSNYIFPIVLKNSNFENRDRVRGALHEKGIQTSVHYPATHRFSFYKNSFDQLPITDYVTDNEITLPLFSKLEEEQISYIAEILKTVVK
jgi:dTDP-4-amino-4,6-dideoxygalactose transaminase